MITTNDLKRLLDEIDRLPYKPTHYQWLKDLLEEVEKSPTVAVQIGIVKSPRITDEF